MHTPEAEFWIALALVDGIGPGRLKRLYTHFGALATAWQASTSALLDAGLDSRSAQGVQQLRAHHQPEEALRKLSAFGVDAICWPDERYPRLLRHIANPPMVLYARGELLPADEVAVAIVGTRQPSAYGRQAAQQLAHHLAEKGVTIISGLARGVDGEVHRAALEAGGRTIAVLGSGLNVIYPREHTALAGAISRQGAVLSDYPLDAQPDAVHFPARNRIVSGMALGTIVVEAGETSGALITARFAGEQGRDVFAVPGSIFSRQSLGVHRLIQDGAKLVATADDVLEELNLGMVAHQLEMQQLLEPQDPAERALLGALAAGPKHVDELARETKLPIAQVSGTLALLELNGLIRQVSALTYAAH